MMRPRTSTTRSVRRCMARCAAFMAAGLALQAALAGPAALAGQIRESDIVISSQVGKVRTEAEGRQVQSRALVHTVDVRKGSHTGDVQVTGKAGGVTTQVGGQNSSAASAVGGVSVGDK